MNNRKMIAARKQKEIEKISGEEGMYKEELREVGEDVPAAVPEEYYYKEEESPTRKENFGRSASYPIPLGELQLESYSPVHKQTPQMPKRGYETWRKGNNKYYYIGMMLRKIGKLE